MNERIRQELDMVRVCYPDLEFIEDGRWVRIPRYRLPTNVWSLEGDVEVCFQVPEQLPGQAPYGFYARPELCLVAGGGRPNNYEYPASTPFGGEWGKFSWSPEVWQPAAEPAAGSNLLNFVRSFSDRLREGA